MAPLGIQYFIGTERNGLSMTGHKVSLEMPAA